MRYENIRDWSVNFMNTHGDKSDILMIKTMCGKAGTFFLKDGQCIEFTCVSGFNPQVVWGTLKSGLYFTLQLNENVLGYALGLGHTFSELGLKKSDW